MSWSACAPCNGTQFLTFHALGNLPLAPASHSFLPCGQLFQGTPSHVPHESRRPGSRHLCAGHHLASKSGNRQAHPGPSTNTRF